MADDDSTDYGIPLVAQVYELIGSHKSLKEQFRAHEVWDAQRFDGFDKKLDAFMERQSEEMACQTEKLDKILIKQAEQDGAKAVIRFLSQPIVWIFSIAMIAGGAFLNYILKPNW